MLCNARKPALDPRLAWLALLSLSHGRPKASVEDLLSKSETPVLVGISTFSVALRKKGIRLIIVPNLLSDRFVPGELHGTVSHLPSPPRFDHLLPRVAALPNLAAEVLVPNHTSRLPDMLEKR